MAAGCGSVTRTRRVPRIGTVATFCASQCWTKGQLAARNSPTEDHFRSQIALFSLTVYGWSVAISATLHPSSDTEWEARATDEVEGVAPASEGASKFCFNIQMETCHDTGAIQYRSRTGKVIRTAGILFNGEAAHQGANRNANGGA